MHAVATADPASLMDALGKALLDKQNSMNFAFRKVSLGAIPDDVVLAWLKAHDVDGARALARHVIAPDRRKQGWIGFIPPTYNNSAKRLYFREDSRLLNLVLPLFSPWIHQEEICIKPVDY
jgi:hypothetical protein